MRYYFNYGELMNLCIDILKILNVPYKKAEALAGNLLRADSRGIKSHGLNFFSMYIEMIENGLIKPMANYEVIKETESSALIDGHMDIGQFVCQEAVKIAINKAKKNLFSIIGIKNMGHAGHIGDYTRMISDNKLIGIMYLNCDIDVAPFGGREKVIGTNPMSYAIPAGEEDPIIIDFATSATAGGYILERLRRGVKLEKNWAIDKEGNMTVDPLELFDDKTFPIEWGDNFTGAILPAAGHKGYGLGLLVDILSGALTGGKCNGDVIDGENFACIQAINPEIFVSFEHYSKVVDKLIRKIRLSAPMPGVEKVLIPGDPERIKEKESKEKGIEIEDNLWQELCKICDKYEVNINSLLK